MRHRHEVKQLRMRLGDVLANIRLVFPEKVFAKTSKAFDTVDHAALWQVLVDQGVPGHYIKVLDSLYQGQV